MLDVRAIKKRMKIAEQSDAPDWPPANIFDQTVARIGLRSDHHFAARKFAIAEGKKQAAAPVEFCSGIGSQRKRAPVKTCQTRQHAQKIAEFAPAFEAPICDFRHIRRESERQQIDVMQFAAGVFEANHVAGAPFAVQDRLGHGSGIFGAAVISKIAQEGIAGSQRQEGEGAAVPAIANGAWENTVDDFIRSAVTTDGEKIPFARSRSSAAGADLPQRPPPAAGFTIAKKRVCTQDPQMESIAERSIAARICSAKASRLILSEAVRG